MLAVERSVRPETRQVPLILKHPLATLIPFASVVVADPETLRFCTDTLPENVDVELVPATLRKPWIVEVPVVLPWRVVVAATPEVLPIYAVPCTERLVVEA